MRKDPTIQQSTKKSEIAGLLEETRTLIKDALSTMEKSFALSISKFCEAQQLSVSREIDKLMVNPPNIKGTDSDRIIKLEAKVTALQETVTKQKDENWSLKTKIQSLQNELQTKKNQHESQISNLEHKIKSINCDNELRFQSTTSEHNVKIIELNKKLDVEVLYRKNSEEEVCHLQNKIKTLCDENEKLTESVKTLKSTIYGNEEEILSLKMHNSRQSDLDVQPKKQEVPVSTASPQVLLIGTSNTRDIEPSKLSSKFSTSKKTAYTFDQTKDCIRNSANQFNIVCLHSLTNEIKDKTPNQCITELDSIIQMCREKWPEAKILLSLGTPR